MEFPLKEIPRQLAADLVVGETVIIVILNITVIIVVKRTQKMTSLTMTDLAHLRSKNIVPPAPFDIDPIPRLQKARRKEITVLRRKN